MIRDPWLRVLVIGSAAIATLYLVGVLWQVTQQFADILLMFFLAWLLAFVLEPVVGVLMTRARFPRTLAIGLTYSSLLILLSLGLVLLVPALTSQVVAITQNLPTYAERVTVWAADLQGAANSWLLANRSPLKFDAEAALNPQEVAKRIEALGPPLLANAVQFAASAATVLVELVLVLILSFYFMLDGQRISTSLIRTLPPRAQDESRFLIASTHRSFAGFLRGQVIQALVNGIGTGLLMSWLQVDYALLASLASGVILLIPFLGPVVALWLPVMIALFTRPEAALWLGVGLLLLQQVIFNVLAPRIMSHQVGLHPLLVFFAVLAGARVAGVWGAVFGVPILAVLVTMVSYYLASRDEQVSRLQEHVAVEDLVSVTVDVQVDPPPTAEGEPRSAPAPVGLGHSTPR